MNDEPNPKPLKLNRVGTRSGLLCSVMLFGVGKGIALEEMERSVGVSVRDLMDPDGRVPDITLARAWRTIGDAFPGQVPGLELAASAPLESMIGPFVQASRFATRRLDALYGLVRYEKALSGGLSAEVLEREDTVALVLRHTLDSVDDGHGAEVGLGVTVRIGRDYLGLGDPVRVSFVHAPRCPVAHYEAWFGCPVDFEAGRNAITLSRDGLEQGPPEADPALYAYIDQHLQLLVGRLLEQTKEAPLDRVRLRIAEHAQRGEYSAEVLARSLGMSLRTLQRFTRKHGESVKGLIEGAREENARRLLADPRIGVEQVAFLVGYSDDRAFRRAFRRWTGQTPAAFRQG